VCIREISSLTLREEHGLRVLENRALRRIFGPNIVEIIECLRKLHNEDLHIFYLPGLRDNDEFVWTVLLWLR
jgi:hypothetical protein